MLMPGQALEVCENNRCLAKVFGLTRGGISLVSQCRQNLQTNITKACVDSLLTIQCPQKEMDPL